MTPITTNYRISWHPRVAGCFWMLFGLLGCAYYAIKDWRLVLGGQIVYLMFFMVSCLLILVGYGLAKHKRWGRIGCGILIPIITLVLLDMLFMSAVLANRGIAFYWLIVGVLAGI